MFCVTLINPTSVLTLFFVLTWSISNYFRAIGLEVEENYAQWNLSDEEITVIGARLRNYHKQACLAARQLNSCFSSILLVVIINIFLQVIANSFLIDWELRNDSPGIVSTHFSIFMMLVMLVYMFAVTYAVDFMTEEEFNLLPILRNFALLKTTKNHEIIQLMNEIKCPAWKITAAGFFKVDRGIILQVNNQGEKQTNKLNCRMILLISFIYCSWFLLH